VIVPKAPILFNLFGRAVSPSFFDELHRRLGLKAKGIYTLSVVVWLIIWQRLADRGTLARAVQQVVQGILGDALPQDKRVRERKVSSCTGGLSRARKRLPRTVVETVCDEIFTKLMAVEVSFGLLDRLFLLDGSSMRLAHTSALVSVYPPGSNASGAAHWPVLRILVAHHLSSGLAARPCWGPMYGKQAVGEQALTKQILDRLPEGAALMGDINFGVFSVVWDAQASKHPVLFRMQESRARRLARPSQDVAHFVRDKPVNIDPDAIRTR
jgi:hypothetical protein